jgi:hypothetical protein
MSPQTAGTDGHTQTWPDLAIGLYDRLTGRAAQITYDFDNMSVKVPSGTGDQASHAEWVVSGTVRISTQDGVDSKK